MTPEERVEKAWSDACRDYQEYKAQPYFAAAVRAAENDALEVAALIAWDCGQTGVAGRIREKKHEGQF